jgi:hypothetical protein
MVPGAVMIWPAYPGLTDGSGVIELLDWLSLFTNDAAAQWLAVAVVACLSLIVYRRVAQR